ncbi:MAG: redox-sensing transcriptional repressor Rex [Lentisphaerae bacterium]|jgi:redox-sensing transcriptional repressor|nr:redox-sensing transcriptional repressor Rex [Lentisphaerota bacterium]MBT4822326.1 redox-sensing transcriptional repressor Rex [Lentisphaerota bacterium]MBT5608491.1 redox-sensing transcriptional repressor Rex [Lentisphaerota bacterium]MBT7058499.1 redox-sensing transcriptional repressor Rex [Lentisphaerota bacterium]MBT7845069.1 redox-sensing transcriptional repressor Rex [Lentisphaerota bacterium]
MVRRLPNYLRLFRELRSERRERVSSAFVAERLSLTAIQVRKDVEAIGVVGRPRLGYELKDLLAAIEEVLGWDNTTDAFLVGAGNLGRALMGYDGFARHGLSIVAAFDTDAAKVGEEIDGRPVFLLSKLPDLARRMHISMVVLAVPGAVAQDVADLLVEAGIQAIWNFAPAHLDVPDHVVVQDEDLARGLAVLSVRWAEARRSRPTSE